MEHLLFTSPDCHVGPGLASRFQSISEDEKVKGSGGDVQRV